MNAPYACVECGHLHYEGDGVWSECPIDGCDCEGQEPSPSDPRPDPQTHPEFWCE